MFSTAFRVLCFYSPVRLLRYVLPHLRRLNLDVIGCLGFIQAEEKNMRQILFAETRNQ